MPSIKSILQRGINTPVVAEKTKFTTSFKEK